MLPKRPTTILFQILQKNPGMIKNYFTLSKYTHNTTSKLVISRCQVKKYFSLKMLFDLFSSNDTN